MRSALAQREVDHEVIVVVDGTKDADSLAPLLSRAASDRIRAIQLPERVGMAAARNAGLAEATGEWVAFLDDDDLWAPGKLRGQLDAAGRAHADLAYSGVLSVDDRGRLIHPFAPPEPAELATELLRMNVIPAGASNVLVRRSLAADVGGFDEAFVHLADWDAWIRLAAAARAAAGDGFTVAYVQHAGTHGGSDAAGVRRDLGRLKAKHADRLAVDEHWFARWHAGALLRAGDRAAAARLYAGTGLRNHDLACLARAAHAALGLPVTRRRGRAPAWVAAAIS